MADTQPPSQELGSANTALVTGLFGSSVGGWNQYIDEAERVPELAWPASNTAFERMRTDAQIAGLIAGITLPIRRYDWRIDPADATPEAAQALAEDMNLPLVGDSHTAAIASSDRRFNHDDHLRHALLAMPLGFNAFEIVGEIEQSPRAWWRMKKLAPRLPRTIQSIHIDPKGEITGIRQLNMPIGSSIPASSLVWFAWEREGAQWTGRSILRPMYRNWLIKDRLLRVDAMKHERNGMGIPVTTAPPGATPDVIAQLAAAAQSVKAGDASGAALPPGAKMELLGVSGSLPDTVASIRMHDEAMAKSMLMMFMSLGTSETGSRALGDSFVDFFSLAQDAVASWYASTMQEQFIERWVEWNLGPGEACPRLVYSSSQDRSLAVTDLVALINAGALTVDAELEAWIRDNHHVPAKSETSAPTPPPAQLAPAPTPAPAQPVAASSRRLAGIRRAIMGAITRPRQNAHTHAAGGYTATSDYQYADRLPADRPVRRMLLDHEIAAQTNYSNLEQQFTSSLDATLKAWGHVNAEMIAEIKAQVIAAKGDPVKLAAMKIDHTSGAQVLTESLLAHAAASSEEAVAEASRQGVEIKKAASSAYDKALTARANGVAMLLANSATQSAAAAAMRYTGGGAKPEEVAAKVVDHLASLTGAYTKDAIGASLTAAQNEARFATFGAAKQSNTIYASELLDSNTCGPCAEIDGTEYASEDEARIDYPVAGYEDCEGGDRCRGTLVFVFDESSS